MDDLLVVGMDLLTGQTVHVGDAPSHVWKAKGHGGDGTLVCRHCFLGDGVPAGTKVPLVYRGRLHGKRRKHFAHPPCQGLAGKHRPETPWHANGKRAIASWACLQPGVVNVCLERWTADGRRRSDARVTLRGGICFAFEVQQQPLTDSAWNDRHSDYAAAGIIDVWLWHPRIGVQGVALGQPQCHWQLNKRLDRIGIPVAGAHIVPGVDVMAADPRLYEHYPPCPGDQVVFVWCELSKLALSASGLVLPKEIHDRLEAGRFGAQRKRRRGASVSTAVKAVTSAQPVLPIFSADGD